MLRAWLKTADQYLSPVIFWHTARQFVWGFLCLTLKSSTFQPCRPTSFPIPKHGLPVAHALNLNQCRANCSSSPSAVISPAEGAFSVTGLESPGEVCGWGEEGREGGRGAHTPDKQAWILVEWLEKGGPSVVWDYSVSGFAFGARLRWRLWDGVQRRSGKAGHHEWRGAEEEAEGEAEETTGHGGQPSTSEVPLLLHPQKSLPQGLHQHRGVEVSFMSGLSTSIRSSDLS